MTPPPPSRMWAYPSPQSLSFVTPPCRHPLIICVSLHVCSYFLEFYVHGITQSELLFLSNLFKVIIFWLIYVSFYCWEVFHSMVCNHVCVYISVYDLYISYMSLFPILANIHFYSIFHLDPWHRESWLLWGLSFVCANWHCPVAGFFSTKSGTH